MTETKLTKREFDAAALAFRGELGYGMKLDWDELERGSLRDYFKMRRSFKVDCGNKVLGLKLEVSGSLTMDKDASAIRVNGSFLVVGETRRTAVVRPDLWGEYDVYEGKWTLRWL